MSKCRIIENPDGTVVVFHPSLSSKLPGETDDQCTNRMIARFMENNPELVGRPFADCDTSDLPNDRTERDKWKLDKRTKKVKVERP